MTTLFYPAETHSKRSPPPLPVYWAGQWYNHERLLPSTLENGTPLCPLTTVYGDVVSSEASISVLLHAFPLLDYTIITTDTGVVKEKISSDTSQYETVKCIK
ncbi:hypothetical protein Pyn_02463 [Prunus yedoensis var. nudiflora]|uniref:Uncharacterized protein n=1 Tax=Prunus yedoensis var. nudiflora TaxID=2094558 RepID=A0A314YJB8_PRUYE|nr:hypothetical protein Pyn_02463 [Prunus yedoensis var. nudiflora]